MATNPPTHRPERDNSTHSPGPQLSENNVPPELTATAENLPVALSSGPERPGISLIVINERLPEKPFPKPKRATMNMENQSLRKDPVAHMTTRGKINIPNKEIIEPLTRALTYNRSNPNVPVIKRAAMAHTESSNDVEDCEDG